jgi:hypothetical protein
MSGVSAERPERPHVEMRGVALYALWPPGQAGQAASGPLAKPPDVWGEHVRVGLWAATHLVWRPDRPGAPTPWLSPEQAEEAIVKLRAHLGAPAPVADGTPTDTVTTPAYLIVHVRDLRTSVPRAIEERVRRTQRTQRMRRGGGTGRGNPATWAQQAALRRLLEQLGVAEVDPQLGWSPGYFDHFDRSFRQRGWVVVAPGLALVAGLDAEQVRTLATLIQPRDVDITGSGRGLLSDRYESVLGRITEWNGTQDIFEAVSQLEALVESGEKSTDGQVWLNFALAAIGVLIALFTGPRLGYWQTAPLLLLAAASLLHALYARSGHFAWQLIAWAFWIIAIATAIAVLASLLPLVPFPLPVPVQGH